MNRKKTFIILGGAELPWIYPLGVALSQFGHTTAIRLGVSTSLFRQKVVWPFEENPENFVRQSWCYPPGFNGKLAFLFTSSIRTRLKRIIDFQSKLSGEHPFVIMPEPRFCRYLQDVCPSRVIYLNFDDLSIDCGTRGCVYLPEENSLVHQANTILCSSNYQALQFRQRFKDTNKKIVHFPHGVNELFINPTPLSEISQKTVCAVGTLSYRYDWKLIHYVAKKLPNIQFLFVGSIDQSALAREKIGWLERVDATLKLANVVHIAGLAHRETPHYFWRSSVNWMPYDTNLRFVQACCPLKLMDGIASGRTVISADVPECRLYPEWVSIYKTADEAVGLLRTAMESEKSSVRREKQIQFALNNTWVMRAKKLVAILSGQEIIERSEMW